MCSHCLSTNGSWFDTTGCLGAAASANWRSDRESSNDGAGVGVLVAEHLGCVEVGGTVPVGRRGRVMDTGVVG